MSSPVKAQPLRLKPGQDLKHELVSFTKRKGIAAGFIASCSGSLQKLKIRLADSNSHLERAEKFEILSLQGTLSQDGVHLHLSVADKEGKVFGGHLVDGCEIYTTAEILIIELDDYQFSREKDAKTGFAELVIHLIKS